MAKSGAKSYLKLVTPTEVNETVAPVTRPNAELRTREHLTPEEVGTLVEPAQGAQKRQISEEVRPAAPQNWRS
jgi:hypothetical protein